MELVLILDYTLFALGMLFLMAWLRGPVCAGTRRSWSGSLGLWLACEPVRRLRRLIINGFKLLLMRIFLLGYELLMMLNVDFKLERAMAVGGGLYEKVTCLCMAILQFQQLEKKMYLEEDPLGKNLFGAPLMPNG